MSLLQSPLCSPADLGKPIPDSPHATSVCLPTWADNIGYEEADPRVIDRLMTGYPRFVFHRQALAAFAAIQRDHAADGEVAMVLPSLRSAAWCIEYLQRHAECQARRVPLGQGCVAVLLPEAAWPHAKDFWQHSGEILSSRQASALLDNTPPDHAAGHQAQVTVREQLAAIYQVPADHVFLYPTGMAAMAAAKRRLDACHPGRRSVQVGFPYVDVFKVQQRFGAGAVLLDDGPTVLDRVRELIASEPVSGCVAEVPGNPLLTCPDIPALHQATQACDGLMVVDDTIASPLNVSVLPYADLVMSSLTKYVSGVGDVMAGSLVVSPHAPRAQLLRQQLASESADMFWQDAVTLADNARDFPQRMRAINHNAQALADYLTQHPAIERVYFPSADHAPAFATLQRPDAGCGGLLAFDLVDAAQRAPAVFDRLAVCKGPSLGTNFTLACPYTILAHYHELDWAEQHGLSRWLIRVSVGTEPIADLIARFNQALNVE